MLRIFFNFFFVKKSFEQSIQLLAKHLRFFWAAENGLFFIFVFWKKTLVIQFPYMEIVWLAFFWWWRQKFFVFFSNRKLIFVFKQTIFEEKKFCMQNLIFCVYNVVLDILILDFFSFSLHNFFQNA